MTRGTIYLVDMHEPLMFLHNLETTIKEPFASNPAVLRAIEKNHKKLQIAMTKLYPGNLVLSLSSGVMHHRLVDRITSLNDVPREPPRSETARKEHVRSVRQDPQRKSCPEYGDKDAAHG